MDQKGIKACFLKFYQELYSRKEIKEENTKSYLDKTMETQIDQDILVKLNEPIQLEEI